MISIAHLLTGEPIRLRYVKRFSICPRVHEESVAEHSYYVAFICMMLAEDLKASGVAVRTGLLLSRALIHDLDEVFSGDFIRMFKHANETVLEAIDHTSKDMMTAFTSEYPAGKKLMEYWSSSKANDIEGRILAYADYLSVLSYIWQEIHAGNLIMFNQLDEMVKFHNSFMSSEFEFLRSYHTEATGILNKLRRMRCKNE